MNNAPVYLVFGPQGSGKSTQAELLSEKLKLPFFDSGANLRDFVESGKGQANKVASKMKAGALVSNDILRKILDDFIANYDCSNGLVADGFPRNMQQVKLFQQLVKEHNWKATSFYVDISDETAKDRLSKRYKLVNGKKIFRNDDRPNIVTKRLELFKKETLPVINWLRDNHKVFDIDGEPSKEKVFEQIIKNIND